MEALKEPEKKQEDLIKKAFEEGFRILKGRKKAQERVIAFYRKNSNLIKRLEIVHYHLINSLDFEIKLKCAIELCSEGIASWRREINALCLDPNFDATALKKELEQLEAKYEKIAALARDYFSEKQAEMLRFNLTEASFQASDLYKEMVSRYITLLPDIKEILQWTFGETPLFKGLVSAAEVTPEEEELPTLQEPVP